MKNLINNNSADGGAHARALQCVINTVSQPDLGRVPQRKPFPDLPLMDDTANEFFFLDYSPERASTAAQGSAFKI